MKVAANDARLLRKKSKKQSIRRLRGRLMKKKKKEKEEEEEHDDDETPSNCKVETSSQSIKAHDLSKQVQHEESP